MRLTVMDIGTADYQETLDLQFDLVSRRQAEEIDDTLVLVEHPRVITMGKSAVESDILLPPNELKKMGVEVFRIGRGGEVTYHGPGQLVGYLVINLYNHQRKLRRFIDNVEEVFVRMLEDEYGISAHHDEKHRGVWVDNDKITAIGIAVKRSVTMHGFAFNVHTRLEDFDWIVPCGIRDGGQTSLQKLLKRKVSLEEVKPSLVRHFCTVFGYVTPTGYEPL